MISRTDRVTHDDAGQHAVTPMNEPAFFRKPVFLMVNTLETGGTERQFVEMVRALRTDGVPVHLGCIRKQGPFSEHLGEIAEFRLGGNSYGWRSLRSRWRLRQHLLRLGVSLAHSFDFYSNLSLIPAAKLAGIPVIGSHRQLGDLLSAAQFRAQLAAFRLCDRVMCNSEAAGGRLVRAGLPSKKVVVVGNALPPAAFREIVSRPFPDGSVIRVGMIARMNAAYKNHHVFLRAAKLLSERDPRLEFVLAGDGPLREELEKEAERLTLRDKVHFVGDCREIAGLLATLDVSVVPSASESLSNVVLESMAAGVPVVATAVGGNNELGGDGRAVLVPVNDEAALASAVDRVIQDRELRAAMVRNAQNFVRSNFSVDEICKRYEQVYAEVLSENQRPAAGRSSQSQSVSAIRVALVAPSLRYVGGQAVQADLLMRHWTDDPDIAAEFLPVDPRFPFGLRWTENIPLLRTLLREPLYLWRLWTALKDVDVAHIFSASYTSFLLAPLPASIVARMRGKRFLINYRSGEARDHLTRSALARRVLRTADGVVVPSGYLADVFREFGIPTHIVPNIIDLSQFRYRERPAPKPHLVCTRGFHPYYGIDVVVRAFAEIQKDYPEAQLDLVGGGSLEMRIRNLVAELHLKHVKFAGVVSRREIGSAYDRAEIFVNASNLDNMPVSVLEAFASGTPVVSTDPEGMKFIVDHERTGLLSQPGDVNALAHNIRRVLEEPGLGARLARNAFEQSKQYHWKSVRERWLALYSSLTVTEKSRREVATTVAP
jgi:glycosyltransferase involved in cell wall biosynthesis